jgi:hypothetical protein
VPVSIEGSNPGDLYEGKNLGDAAIFWVIPNVISCATVVLSMVAADMSRERALREIVRVAESLRPSD